jgi:alpha-glucoside transport system substrate-binding protein
MRRFRWFLLIALLAVIGAACADTPDEGGDTTGAPEATTAAPDGTTAAPDGTTAAPTGTTSGEAAGAYPHLEAAMAGDYAGTEVEVLAQWIEAQAEAFEAVLAPFEEATGITVNYEGPADYETVLATRVEGGNAPDLAQTAQPATMRAFAEAGALVPLSDWIDMDQIGADYLESFIDLASVDGTMYGLFFNASLKSIVWYPVQAFADAGYEIPTTWDDLVALSNQIIADGNGNPWCISVEHGDVSGWVATDWIEDILLRTAPVEVYDQWAAHEIPFDDPEVLEAAEYMSEIWFAPDYVFGGNTGINATFVGDTQTPMFNPDGPQCWMHKQAAWIPDFWPEGTVAGEDSAFFYFPPIEDEFGNPVLGSGDQFLMFEDRPEVRALVEYLATPEAALPWIERGGFVSANQRVPVDAYTNYPDTDLAAILAEADVLRFDASDSMPGGPVFNTGMVDWIANNGEGTEDVLAEIEANWPE